MICYARTDIGRQRKMNQDSLFASVRPVGPLPNLFMVADGMGGHKAGDYASRFVVETIEKNLKDMDDKEPVAALMQSIERTNLALFSEARKDPEKEGMGSTLVAVTMVGNVMYVANVGDSRLYLLRDETKPDHQGPFSGGGNGGSGENGAEQRTVPPSEKHYYQS